MPQDQKYQFNWLRTHLKNAEEVRAYARDACMLAVTGTVIRAMEDAHLSRGELATRIGRDPSFVTQVLSGSRNMTLRTLADMLWACDQEVRGVAHVALGQMSVPDHAMNAWLDTESLHHEALLHDEIEVSREKNFDVSLQTSDELACAVA